MKDIVQGESLFVCECRRKNFECEYSFLYDSDWQLAREYKVANNLEMMYSGRTLYIVRNEHVPLKGCVVVKKFERSSIIYYT